MASAWHVSAAPGTVSHCSTFLLAHNGAAGAALPPSQPPLYFGKRFLFIVAAASPPLLNLRKHSFGSLLYSRRCLYYFIINPYFFIRSAAGFRTLFGRFPHGGHPPPCFSSYSFGAGQLLFTSFLLYQRRLNSLAPFRAHPTLELSSYQNNDRYVHNKTHSRLILTNFLLPLCFLHILC